MKALWAALLAAALTAGMIPDEAEARRLGGARALGTQRQIATPTKPSQPPSAASQESQAPAASSPRPGMSRWLAPLAGLAAGLGLAALFGEDMGALIIGLLIVFAIMLTLRLLFRAVQPRPDPRELEMQYADLGRETVPAPPPSQLPTIAAVPGVGQAAARIPPGFDTEGFLRQARKNFIALQAANDRGDLEAIRDLVTEEMFDALERDVVAHHSAGGDTDVVTLNADLLEVATEKGMHHASIRFFGMLREDRDGPPTPFEEVWNLQKPGTGRSGWLLAGIQQVS
jgi:predicted lipid-binding transport protein (Tim44 family)